MNTRRSLLTNLCSFAAIAAAGTSLSAIAAGPSGRAVLQGENRAARYQVVPTDPSYEAAGAPGHVWTPGSNAPTVGLRNADSCVNTGCQLGYRTDQFPAGARNALGATVIDNFHPTSAGPLTKLSWSGHLRAGGGGFANPWRDGTVAEVGAIGANETFTVTIYNTNPVTNVPDFTSIFYTQQVSVPRTLDTTTQAGPLVNITGGVATLARYAGDNVGGPFQVYNYCTPNGALPGCPPFDTSKCYWLGIRHASGMPDAFQNDSAGWRWMMSSPGAGENLSYQKFDNDPNFSFWSQLNTFDFTFCMDVAIGPGVCPVNAANSSCPIPNLDGSAGNTQCQPPNIRSTGGLIVSPSNKGISTGNGNTPSTLSSDNFTVTQATTLKGICFTGSYGGLVNTTQPAPDEAFSIRIFKNNTNGPPFYGYLDYTQQVGPTIVIKPHHPTDPSRNSNNALAWGSASDVAAAIEAGGQAGDPFPVTGWPAAGGRETTGVTMTTVPNLFLSSAGIYDHSVDLSGMAGGGIALPSAGCYWIGIMGLCGTIDPPLGEQWRWVLRQWQGVSGGTLGDGFNNFHNYGILGTNFAAADIGSGYDNGMCLSFAPQVPLSINTPCPGTPLSPNKDCANASTLVVPLAPHLLDNTLNTQNNGATGNPPGFGTMSATDFSPGLFYKFTNGASDQQIVVSTCNQNENGAGGLPTKTGFDTMVSVYCGACGSLKAIADNDDANLSDCTLNSAVPANNTGASLVRFPAKAGETYYIYVTGNDFGGETQGFYWLSIDASAIDPLSPAVTCASIFDPPCALTIPPADANNVLEFAFCGALQSDDNDTPCPLGNLTNHMFQLTSGQTGWGTVDTHIPVDLTRDNDWWEILPQAGLKPIAQGDPQYVYRITVTPEVPVLVSLETAVAVTPGVYCPTDPNIAVSTFIVQPCNTDYIDFVAQDIGKNFLDIRPTTFTGLPCGARNKYKISVASIAQTEVGACCRGLAPICIQTTRTACTSDQSTDGSILGVFVGGACTPAASQPCDFGNIILGSITRGASLLPFGSCCQPDGSCTLSTQAGCPTNNGGIWTVKFTRPASCANLGRCCNGASCTSVTFATCQQGGGIWRGPSATCVGSSCNVQTPYNCGAVTPDNCCPYPALNFRSVCDPDPCKGPIMVQRCCFTDGSCLHIGPTLCGQLGGTSSPGVCLPQTCPRIVPGACCKADHSACTITTMAACLATVGNVYKGDGTFCNPDPCTGTCCAGAICKVNLFAACTTLQASAKWTLGGNGPCPGTNINPCCKANFNHQGVISVQDIFDFLTAYFGGKTIADIANNGAGAPTVQSIFSFLAAYFAGGCT